MRNLILNIMIEFISSNTKIIYIFSHKKKYLSFKTLKENSLIKIKIKNDYFII